MRSFYSGIVQVGNDYAYLDAQKSVCGLLKSLDDQNIIRNKSTPQKRPQKATGAYAVNTRWKGGD